MEICVNKLEMLAISKMLEELHIRNGNSSPQHTHTMRNFYVSGLECESHIPTVVFRDRKKNNLLPAPLYATDYKLLY